VTELCSGQALGDADDDADADTDAADAADKSNPYMSPFQGDTKRRHETYLYHQQLHFLAYVHHMCLTMEVHHL
jgi:hypothetical protein